MSPGCSAGTQTQMVTISHLPQENAKKKGWMSAWSCASAHDGLSFCLHAVPCNICVWLEVRACSHWGRCPCLYAAAGPAWPPPAGPQFSARVWSQDAWMHDQRPCTTGFRGQQSNDGLLNACAWLQADARGKRL
eukprot:scaffold93791_cov22-Tisochrysis_lutea.AAC.1